MHISLASTVSTRAALEGPFHLNADALEQKLKESPNEHGVNGAYRVAGGKSKSWTDVYAHCADLVIASQHDPEASKRMAEDIVEPVLLSAGVPVLILPTDWTYVLIGRRIALAWNGSREATRAAHDAMPFLRAAEKVMLFAFGPHADLEDTAPNLMAEHLRRNSARVDVETWPDLGDVSPISALFASLDENEIDLIVSGAFGHSRLFEGLFGGVSNDLLHNPPKPVLMSH